MSELEASIEAVRSLFEDTISSGREEVITSILAQDFLFQYPLPGFPAGRDGIRRFSRLLRSALSDFAVEIHDLFGANHGDESHVAIRWSAHGRHTGNFLGLAPTGRHVTFTAIGMYGSHGETLIDGYLEMDVFGLLQQMGAVPSISELLPELREVQ